MTKSGEIAPQFKKTKISIDSIVIGVTIFIIGLFKKIIIADGLAPCANSVFNATLTGLIPSFAEAWFGAICYTLQLYFDFSGYSDMAIGLARIFNVHFPINFDSPYQSTSIIDFWHRWHITLSNFFKNYLYIPMGGNRNGIFTKYRNLIVTMLIGGLWHGANWTFVLWGLLHGIYLVINHLWHNFINKKKLIYENKKVYAIFCWIITILCIIFAWVLFRAQDLKSAFVIYKSMLGFHRISISPTLLNIIPNFSFIDYTGFFKNQLFYSRDYFSIITLSIFICLCLPNIKTFFKQFISHEQNNHQTYVYNTKYNIFSLTWTPSKIYAFVMVIMTTWAIIALLSARKIEFLYFNF